MHFVRSTLLLVATVALPGVITPACTRPTELQRENHATPENSTSPDKASGIGTPSTKLESSEPSVLERQLPTILIALHPLLYRESKNRGERLLGYLTDLPSELETPWKDFGELAAWGWSETVMTDGKAIKQGIKDLEDVLAALDVEATAPGNVGYLWQHTRETTHGRLSQAKQQRQGEGEEVGGRKDEIDTGMTDERTVYPRTWGSYENVLNAEQGVIIARKNHGPVFMSKVKDVAFPAHSPVTLLRSWSDVVYLTWAQLTTPEQRANLKYVLRDCIDNQDSIKLIGDVLRKVGKTQAGPWPGVLISKTKTTKDILGAARTGLNGPWLALLGCPNARGVVYLLAQHAADVGRGKTIGGIRIWDRGPGTSGESIFCMLIEILRE